MGMKNRLAVSEVSRAAKPPVTSANQAKGKAWAGLPAGYGSAFRRKPGTGDRRPVPLAVPADKFLRVFMGLLSCAYRRRKTEKGPLIRLLTAEKALSDFSSYFRLMKFPAPPHKGFMDIMTNRISTMFRRLARRG
jgi:hypothetical protein